MTAGQLATSNFIQRPLIWPHFTSNWPPLEANPLWPLYPSQKAPLTSVNCACCTFLLPFAFAVAFLFIFFLYVCWLSWTLRGHVCVCECVAHSVAGHV